VHTNAYNLRLTSRITCQVHILVQVKNNTKQQNLLSLNSILSLKSTSYYLAATALDRCKLQIFKTNAILWREKKYSGGCVHFYERHLVYEYWMTVVSQRAVTSKPVGQANQTSAKTRQWFTISAWPEKVFRPKFMLITMMNEASQIRNGATLNQTNLSLSEDTHPLKKCTNMHAAYLK